MLEDLPVVSYNTVFGVSDITSILPVPTAPTVGYVQPAGTRADIIADKYYGDARSDYLVYLANKTTNPLDFAVPTDSAFDTMIIAKYGSVEQAQKMIAYFQNNWAQDDTVIVQATYDSLPYDVKQLYDLTFDSLGRVSGYKRKPINIRKSTSEIVTYTITSPCPYVEGTYVQIFNGPSQVGTGRVQAFTDTTVVVDHIVGSYSGDSLFDLNEGSLAVSPSVVIGVITPTEAPYYSPVSVYADLYDKVTRQRQSVVLYALGTV